MANKQSSRQAGKGKSPAGANGRQAQPPKLRSGSGAKAAPAKDAGAAAQGKGKPAGKSAKKAARPNGGQQVEAPAYKRVVLVGSPKSDGRCAALANEIFEASIEECPQDVCQVLSCSTLDIRPCTGCNGCAPEAGMPAGPILSEEGDLACVIADDMAYVYEGLETADELIIVAPVYFAGPSAQLKAMLDRFQPYFWTSARHGAKRPATLHIVGEGHDPFGYDPLVTIVQSALYCAGFELMTIFDWVGCLDAQGNILEDAQEYRLAVEESYGFDGEGFGEDGEDEGECSPAGDQRAQSHA